MGGEPNIMVSACYLEFEIRGIDLTDVSMIVLLEQKHKTQRQKVRIQRAKMSFVRTLLNKFQKMNNFCVNQYMR